MLLNPYRFAVSGGGGGGSDPDFASVVSLMHLDGTNGSTTFTDQTGLTWSAVGAGALSSAQSKFGTTSLACNGSGGSIVASGATSQFTMGTGDFTIEAWVYCTAVATEYQTVFQLDSNIHSLGVRTFGGGDGFAYWYDNGLRALTPTVPLVGQWVHVAVSRDSGTLRVFLNGTKGSSDFTSTQNYSTAFQARVGAPTAGLNPLAGYISEVRVTKGVARYTADFTPPAAPFPDS